MRMRAERKEDEPEAGDCVSDSRWLPVWALNHNVGESPNAYTETHVSMSLGPLYSLIRLLNVIYSMERKPNQNSAHILGG